MAHNSHNRSRFAVGQDIKASAHTKGNAKAIGMRTEMRAMAHSRYCELGGRGPESDTCSSSTNPLLLHVRPVLKLFRSLLQPVRPVRARAWSIRGYFVVRYDRDWVRVSPRGRYSDNIFPMALCGQGGGRERGWVCSASR